VSRRRVLLQFLSQRSTSAQFSIGRQARFRDKKGDGPSPADYATHGALGVHEMLSTRSTGPAYSIRAR
jgi:hypothetical protein